MKASLVFWAVVVALFSLARSLRGEGTGELLHQNVMLVAADVTFRTAPSPESSVGENTTGGYLDVNVDADEGHWVRLKRNWVGRGDVVPLEAAVGFFSAQIERRPTAFAYASRSHAWLKRAEFEKSLEDADEAVRRDPDFPLGYTARAHVKSLQGDLDGSLQDYEKALTRDPKLKVALRGREFVHKLLHIRYGGVAAIAADRSAELPQDHRLIAARLFDRALSTGNKGNHRQAIAELEEAVRLAPELRTATFFSSRSHQFSMLREYEKARADLEQAISLEPNNADHYSAIARVCHGQGDLDGMITNFERFYEIRNSVATKAAETKPPLRIRLPDHRIEIQNQLVGAYIERGNNRSTNGDWAGATTDFDRAVELDPSSAQTRISRALFRAREGKYDQALKDCDAVASLDPRSSLGLCSRGVVYQIKGDMAKAIDTFGQAVILFPKEASPLSARADVWRNLGHSAKALDDINRAISLEPESGFWYAQRANILRELKRDDEAAADFKRAQELVQPMIGRLRNGQ